MKLGLRDRVQAVIYADDRPGAQRAQLMQANARGQLDQKSR